MSRFLILQFKVNTMLMQSMVLRHTFGMATHVNKSFSSYRKSMSGVMDENRPYCRSLYEFKGEYDNELSFDIGEIIYLRRRVNNEWLEGELQSNATRAGIFPANFVEIVVDFCSSDGLFSSSGGSCDGTSHFTSTTATSGVALVMHDFNARYEDELTVRCGDSLKVVEIIDENWARCQHSVSGYVGIVPQSYLQIFLENESALSWSENSSLSKPIDTVVDGQRVGSSEKALDIPWNVDWIGPRLTPPLDKPQVDTLEKCPSRLHPPLPSLQPLDGAQLEPHRQAQKPPQRPPLPTSASFLASVASTSLADQESFRTNIPQIVGPNRPPIDFQEQKTKIIQDLLTTETAYLFDLNSWEVCISASTAFSDENKRILNYGFPQLRELSKKLIDNIQNEKVKPPESQCYGQILMLMKDDFYRTFSHHCRTVEKIAKILENISDTGLKEALNGCVAEMRKMGSNVFDAPTALSRPIHRCLKYPLYVGELLKNTPINHIDHPKLMESLKQLGNLASKMNECKRRKELIRKYTDEQQLTLSERLSRINVHSFVKKSNRLKYRISSTMGFNTIRDSEFDYLIAQLDSAERRVCKFLYCAQLYKKNLEVAFKKYEDLFRGVTSIEDELLMKALCEFLDELDKIRKSFLLKFENCILSEGRKLVRGDYTRLIHKRCDKLADYETAKSTNKNSGEIEVRRNEYEALNNQVKSGMPKLITNINKRVGELVNRIHESDAELIRCMDALFFKYRQSQNKCNALLSETMMFSNFITNLLGVNRFTEMNRILRNVPNTSMPDNSSSDDFTLKSQVSGIAAQRTASVKSKKSIPLTQKLSSLSIRQKTSANSAARAQTLKERDALVKIIRAQNTSDVLRRVVANFSAENMLLNAGDVVLVKGHKNGKCLCDNGVTLGYVPHDFLKSFSETELLGSSYPTTSTCTSLEDGNTLILDLSSPPKSGYRAPSASKIEENLIDLSGIENLKHFRL